MALKQAKALKSNLYLQTANNNLSMNVHCWFDLKASLQAYSFLKGAVHYL